MLFVPNELDSRNLPAYSIADAARYLTIPLPTLRSWLHGRYYPTTECKRYFQPLIERPNPQFPQLSFTNLVEAHVLRVIRQEHKIRLDKIRLTLDYLASVFGVPHPLAQVRFQTDGVDLFVEYLGNLIAASRDGQLVMREALQHLLRRVEWDSQGIAARLFPLTRLNAVEAPKVLAIDPLIAFGRPVLVDIGIPTAILGERYKAGDSIETLAFDYRCSHLQIEEAIRCEMALSVAA